MKVLIISLGLIALSSAAAIASGGALNAAGCHAGSEPYHCHGKPKLERVGSSRITSQSVRVRDVDTVVVGGVPVRLNGVDGPELSTRAGQDAKRWMVNHLRGNEVTCTLNGERNGDRFIGICEVNGTDIGSAAISAGQALDCRRYSGGRYRHLETPAAKSRIKRAGYCD